MNRIAVKRLIEYYLLFVIVFICISCHSQKIEFQEKLEQMQSVSINIPYEQMQCWGGDSIMEVSPWNRAKLKLIHYLDTVTCSTCYLQKAAINQFLQQMETLSNGDFYNVYIITPNNKAKKKIEKEFQDDLIPHTIFVDTANVFIEANPNIPSEEMYHTFLLDENNNVILVGNPMINKKIEDMMLAIVEEKFGKKFAAKIDQVRNE